MKVTITLEPEHFEHPSDFPPQNFQQWLMLREKASGIRNPKCCDGNRHRQLYQHLPNTSGPVNHNVALRPLDGSSEVIAVVKTLQLTNIPLVPFGKMAALTAICPFRT